MNLHVTFYKYFFHGMDEPTLGKVEFEHPIDDNLTPIENFNAAYDKAVELGHRPWLNIEFKQVE